MMLLINSFCVQFSQIMVNLYVYIYIYIYICLCYSHYGYSGVTNKNVYLFNSALFKRSFLDEFSKKMAANILVESVRCVRLAVFYTRTEQTCLASDEFL